MSGIYGSLETARQNLARYADARSILDGITRRVSRWVSTPDPELVRIIPSPSVPRAFNSSFDGCPVHGRALFKFGNYSWIMDPFNRPWKLKCPVGGEEYPSNDFQRFLDSGMKDRSLLTGNYADDGWGWRRKGEQKKHWFVAYYCHWLWYSYIIPAVLDLSRAYLLTGREIYGRKCLVMLHKVAEYYPAMDHNKQSRYGTEFDPSYQGKIVNCIWETNVIRQLAESVANVRTYVTDATAATLGMGREELIAFLEERILLEGLAGIRNLKIVGNYGMHQNAMLVILKALHREEETRRGLDHLLNNPSGGYWHQGLRYALDNYIYREGMSFENAPGYCFTWTTNLLSIAEHLASLGVEFPDPDKLRKMLEAPERLLCLGKYTPAIGDFGSVTSGLVRLSPRDACRAYRMFRSSSFAKLARPGFLGYEDLFVEPLSREEIVQASMKRRARKASDCLGGYGLVILRAKDLECCMFFGRMDGHGHYDRLGIELFGCGQKFMPDLGYPQFAAESKSPPAWERNTISHNTVTVNERRQDTGSAGQLHMFHAGQFVQVSEASANRTYYDASLYRRTIALVGREHPFFLDIFRVRGGWAHDYSVHGCHGTFRSRGIKLVRRPGTLAGEDVPYGFLYDDPELENPAKTRSYYSYRGSGYSYLYDVRTGRPDGSWQAEWRSPKATLRMFFPIPSGGVVVAKGKPPLRPGNPPFLTYALLRNRGGHLESTFAAVGEVCVGRARIRSARSIRLRSGTASAWPVGIAVKQGRASHLVLSSLDPQAWVEGPGIRFRARFVAVSDAPGKGLTHLFMDGVAMSYGEIEVELAEPFSGKIAKIDYESGSLFVEVHGGMPDPRRIEGEVAFIENDRRSSCFLVREAKALPGGMRIRLEANGRIGRLVAEKVAEDEVRTPTELPMAGHGYYEGTYLVDPEGGGSVRIDRVEKGLIKLGAPIGDFVHAEAYIWEFGPGDRIWVESWLELEKVGRWWKGMTNSTAKVRAGSLVRTVGPGRFRFAATGKGGGFASRAGRPRYWAKIKRRLSLGASDKKV